MRNRRRLIIGGVVLVVVLGGAGAAWAATRPSGPNYRTATAVAGTVTSTLDLTGTIEPVSEATVSFPVTGQVASVAVTQGQQVTAGQTLAQLNTTSMASELDSAQSSVATAQAKLASDQTSQTSTVGGTMSACIRFLSLLCCVRRGSSTTSRSSSAGTSGYVGRKH